MRQATFPTYDGKSDYTFYRAQFLALAASRPVSEWAESLVVALREPASHVLSTLTAAQLTNFSELDGALQTRFGRPRPRNIAVQNLRAARQQPEQTLREFGVQIDLLCRDAYRGDPIAPSVLDKLVLDNFLAGIADPATRRLLLMSRPRDLTMALETASELEDAPSPVKRVRQVEAEGVALSVRDGAGDHLDAKQLATTLAELTAAVRAVQPSPAQSQPQQSASAAAARPQAAPVAGRTDMAWASDGRPICWKCREVGHIGRNCDQPRQQRGRGLGRGRRDGDDHRGHQDGQDRRDRRDGDDRRDNRRSDRQGNGHRSRR